MRESIHPGFDDLTHNPYLSHYRADYIHTRTRSKNHLYASAASIIKGLEAIFSRNKVLFLLYGTLFYRSVLKRELGGKTLPPSARILHIGAGALPYTAYYLAKKRYHIDAIDCDEQAVARAKYLIESLRMTDQVKLIHLDGTQILSKDYDAIWISLHVSDKKKVLKNVIHHAKQGAWIIYREPRSWLSLIYTNITLGPVCDKQVPLSVNHWLGKKSVSIQITESKLGYGKNT